MLLEVVKLSLQRDSIVFSELIDTCDLCCAQLIGERRRDVVVFPVRRRWCGGVLFAHCSRGGGMVGLLLAFLIKLSGFFLEARA